MHLCVLPLMGAAMFLAFPRVLQADAEPYWPPKGHREVTDPAQVGMDGKALDEALTFAGERHSHAVVVVREGKIAGERYWNGWHKDTAGPLHSATKSVTAVLVWMAIEDGFIEGLDQKIYVVPSLDLVVVRLGERAFEKKRLLQAESLAPSEFDGPFLARVCRAAGWKK